MVSIYAKIYNKAGTSIVYNSGSRDFGLSSTIGDVLSNSAVVSLGITNVSDSVGGQALSSNILLTNVSTFDGGTATLYDVAPEPETITGLFLDGTEYVLGGSGGGEWGTITGTLSDQADLNTALTAKADASDVLTKTNTTEFTPTGYYHPATKKYVDDNISAATGGAVSDEAYSASWDGVTGIAPSKNAVYGKISSIDTTISGKADDSGVVHIAGSETITGDKYFNSSNGTTFHTSGNGQIKITSFGASTDGAKIAVYPISGNTNYGRPLVLQGEGTSGNPGGNVGIGVDQPTEKLQVNGNILAYSFKKSNGTSSQFLKADGSVDSTTYAADDTVVKLTGNQTIAGTKTFSTSPAVPSKSTDAGNNATTIATEAQVYKKQDKLTTQTAYASKGTATKVPTITTNTLGQVTAITETSISFPVTSVNGSTGAVTGLQTTANLKTSLSDNSDSYYPSQKAVKTAVDGKQATLVSGTNIKTINGNSLLGSGDITISGGTDYSWVTKTISSGNVEIGLRTIVDNPASNFTLTKPATLKDGEEYVLRTISGATAYTITLGTGFTNPRNVSLVLSANATDQFVFIAIGGELELQPLVATGS